MANEENLIPTSQRSKSEVRAIGRAGGIASGEARRRKKTLRDALRIAMEEEVTNAKGEKRTVGEVSMIQLATLMAKGDLKAIHLGANILGELKQEVQAEVKGDGVTIIVQSAEERDKIENIGGLE